MVQGGPAVCEIYLRDFARWAINVVKWQDLPEELAALAHDAPEGGEDAVVRSVSAAAQSAPQDWRVAARQIGDELFERDTKAGYRDALEGYSKRVMDEMQKRKIHGPRGLIDNHKTIMREALQGEKWWAKKPK